MKSLFFDIEKFEHMQKVAKVFASSILVPEHFRGNIANCLVALDLAHRLQVDPVALMRNMYLVPKKSGVDIALQSQFTIGLLNNSGLLKKRLEWTFDIDEKTDKIKSCTCVAVTKDDQGIQETLTWRDVEKAGWANRSMSFWNSIPKVMFRYRTAALLTRSTFPDLIMGFHTVDEMQDANAETKINLLDLVASNEEEQNETENLTLEEITEKIKVAK